MAPGAGGEARRAGAALRGDHADRILVFELERLALALAFLQIYRAAVGAQTNLRQPRELLRQILGDAARVPLRREPLAQSDAIALVRRHLAAGQDDVAGAAFADEARQAHRAAVDERHAPAPAIDAHVSALPHHPHVAPEPELHPAGDRRPLYRGDDRLRQFKPRRTHGST